MSLELDLNKLEIGAEEVCKIGINFAEIILRRRIGNSVFSGDKNKEEILKETSSSEYREKLGAQAQTAYELQIGVIKEYIKPEVKEKYQKILDKLIESQIKEIGKVINYRFKGELIKWNQ